MPDNTQNQQIHHFRIEGMTCGACSARLQDGLSKSKFIETANVNLAMKTGYVEGQVTEEEIEKLVWDLGYEAIFSKEDEVDFQAIEKKEAEELQGQFKKLRNAILATFPVFLMGMGFVRFPYHEYIQFILTTYVMFFPGRKFFTIAFKLLKNKSANMDSLVALGTGSAWIFSIYILALNHHELYFESAAVIISLVLLGKYLEERAKHNSIAAIRSLSKLQPQVAIRILPDGREEEIAINKLKKGDVVSIRVGEKVPTDGELYEDQSEFDESMLTGEPLPVQRAVGENLTGGTINVGTKPVKMIVRKLGKETVLSQIIKMVNDSQAAKPEIQNLADKISLYFVPAALAIASITFLIWFFIVGKDFEHALIHAVSVLVIACPCALGLATPAAIVTATGRAAEKHILIRSATGIEIAGKVQAIVMDKTGTITKGKPEVTKLLSVEEQYDEELKIIYALEKSSQHPLAVAIRKHIKGLLANIEIEEMAHDEFAGKGMKAIHNGVTYCLGKKSFLVENGVTIPKDWEILEQGHNGLVYFSAGTQGKILFEISDTIRESAIQAVEKLKEIGIELYMATGDRLQVAKDIADQVGIEHIHADSTPSGKRDLIKSIKKENKITAMVGDGINDAPSLAEADLGIALGDGTDVAMSAAHIVLPNGDLSRVFETISLSKETIKIIKQNLFWAFFYNTIAIPLAAAGLLSPMIAAGAMAFSSFSVVINSLRLKRA